MNDKNETGDFAARMAAILSKRETETRLKTQTEADAVGRNRSEMQHLAGDFERVVRDVIAPVFEQAKALLAARKILAEVVIEPLGMTSSGEFTSPGEIRLTIGAQRVEQKDEATKLALEPPVLSYKCLATEGRIERQRLVPSRTCFGHSYSATPLAPNEITRDTVQADVLGWIEEAASAVLK